MATSSKIRIMISSRCLDNFPTSGSDSAALSETRKSLKAEIEAETVLGVKPFEVWINEDTAPQPATDDSWDVCMKAVEDCDILISLSNGNAGWAKSAGEIGIGDGELSHGLSFAPGKVRLISLGNIPITRTNDGKRNKRFQEFVSKQNLFRGGEVKSNRELKERVRQAIAHAIVSLTQQGVLEASRGKSYTGQALDWNRLSYAERRTEIKSVIADAVKKRAGSSEKSGSLFAKLSSTEILFNVDAIPASMTIAAARELVGQPFLDDHKFGKVLTGNRAGPVHVIGCHKNVTETQAINLLGFPDATVVSTTFGVYIADNVQKIQIVLISHCQDDANTRTGVQRFFTWLDQTGEGDLLAKRAIARTRIVKAIAAENA